MNKIKLTKSLLQGALANMFGSTSGNLFGTSASGYYTYLRVYKGVPPTTQEITDLNGTAFMTARAADLLIDIPYNGLWDSNTGNTAKMRASAYTTAQGGGEATFFILYTWNNSQSHINSAIVGTVSNASGNGDLKLSSTTIVAGQSYRVQSLNFAVPMQYEY